METQPKSATVTDEPQNTPKDSLSMETKDQKDETANPFLFEFLEQVKQEIEDDYLKIINRFYYKDIDIQQTLSMESTPMVDQLDHYQRKLLLMAKGDVQLSSSLYNRLAFYFLVREFYQDGLDLLINHINEVDELDVAYNFLGILYYRLGYMDVALETFSKISLIKTSLIGWKYSLGILHYMKENYKKAIDVLAPEKDRYADRTNYLLCLGNCYYYQKDFQNALGYLLKYQEKQDKNQKVVERIFIIYYERQAYGEALPYLFRLKNLGATLKDMEFKFAILYFHTGDLKKAAYQLIEILNFDRSMLPAIDETFIFGLFLKAFELQIYDNHIFYVFKKLLETDPVGNRLDLLRRKSKTLNEMNLEQPEQLLFQAHLNLLIEQYSFTEYYLKKLIQKNIQSKEIIQNLCKVLFLQGKKEEGLDILRQIDQPEELDGEIHFFIAEAYFGNSEYQKTIQSILWAQEKHYENPEMYNLLGFSYYSIGEYEKAIGAYTKLIRLTPEDLDAFNDLGIAYSKVNNFQEAIAQFKYILERDPENKEAHFNLNKVYRLILEEEADEHFNQYVELSKP